MMNRVNKLFQEKDFQELEERVKKRTIELQQTNLALQRSMETLQLIFIFDIEQSFSPDNF